MTAAVYILLGSSLEYIRSIELKILIPIIGIFGLLKIFVSR